MEKNSINPWQWQDNFGYAQAVEVKQTKGTLYCAGQTAMTAEGQPLAGSMEEQLTLTLQNLEAVINKAGYQAAGIVRLNIYTTAVGELFPAYGTLMQWLQQHQIVPASTLLEVKALALPELKVEIEATVVR